MSIFVFQLFSINDRDYNVVSDGGGGSEYDVVIRRERDDGMSLLVRFERDKPFSSSRFA